MTTRETTTHFQNTELEEMKEGTEIEEDEEIMEQWARNNWPIRTASYISLGEIETTEEGGKITVIER